MTISQASLDFDAQHIWHPYTNLQHPSPVFGVESAEGVYLNLSNGQQLVDGMASWWSAIHGYNHPELNRAMQQQIGQMSHVMFGGLTHAPAIELAQKLVSMTDPQLDCVFFSDSGSVAVEVAIKMALQYWVSQAKPEKNRLLTFRGGYHGDTFGAMSVCDPVTGMHNLFNSVLAKQLFAPKPECRDNKDWGDEYIDKFRSIVESNHQQIAAIILEPLVQGAGGMNFYASEYLRQIKKLCDEYHILLIFDEVATGFGRTGSLFAYEEAGVCPDVICLGKAMTGGYLSLAATLCSREIADTISGFQGGNLMHGPTFMANPLACAVANKSIDLLLESNWKSRIQAIESQLLEELLPCQSLSAVSDVRVKGAIGVVELKQPIDLNQIQPRFVELGVWIRPFSSRVYIMPPYIINSEQLSLLTSAIYSVSKECSIY